MSSGLTARAAGPPLPPSIAGITIPDSSAATQAVAQAYEVEDPQVFRHSARSFVFAELISQARSIKHDPETVFISAILHDIGLSKEYPAPHQRFEIAGADIAKGLVAGAHAGSPQAQIAWDAVVLHSIYSIARFKEPEVMLVSAGVITDVGAAFVPFLQKSAVQQVLAALPRAGFNAAFLTVLTDYARRKPDTVSGTFVEDIAMHTVPGYSRGDFYESMQQPDAFEKQGFTQ